MRISKSGSTAKKDTKTLFLPYFKYKTTLVEQRITHTANLITLLLIASGLLRFARNDEQKKTTTSLRGMK
jgi:hypothetical protein